MITQQSFLTPSNPGLDSGSFSFARYLAVKKSIDDRSLNRGVWDCLAESLPKSSPENPLKVLEVGAGIGTMIERMIAAGLLQDAIYTAIDANEAHIRIASERLADWGISRGFKIIASKSGLQLEKEGHIIEILLEAVDLYEFAERERGRKFWDLCIAHAILDLLNIPSTLPVLFNLIEERGSGRGYFYFSINFDGLTAFEPVLDSGFDECIQELYHRTMDERRSNGRPTGGSRSGRRLFNLLRESGAQLLAAGSSDWVVFPGRDGYTADEAYFLHFLIDTVSGALAGNLDLDPARFDSWVSRRHEQIEQGELSLIVHQLDFFGKPPLKTA